MRPLKLILPLALLAAIPLALAACGGGDDQTAAGDQTDRQEAMAELENELEQIDKRLRHVGDRIEDAAGDADDELEKTYAELEDRREELAGLMEDLKNASGDRWRAMHEDVEKSLDEFSAEVEQAWKDLGI